jgi:thiol-disulfide isomerase/thioredoxin
MKSKHIIVFVLSFFLNGIEAQKKPFDFTINGHFKNSFSGYLYIDYENKTDSCLVTNNGFTYRGKQQKDIVSAGFSAKDKPSNVFGVYLEKSTIELELSVSEKITNQGNKIIFFSVESIKGSKTSEMANDFYDFLKSDNQDKNYYKTLYNKAKNIIFNNPKNPLGGNILSYLVKGERKDKEALEIMYAKLDKNDLDKFTIKNIEKNLYPERFVNANQNIFNFILPDRNDKSFATLSLKGKWFLIDFWASWCGPCRAQLPELKRVYDANKSKNFEVVGVSIDEKKDQWIKALDKEQLQWINVIEDKSFKGEVIREYEVNAIPTNFLINPEGKVVEKNISMEALEKLLKTL